MPDGTVYRIADWNRHFEKNRTRELVTMRWIALPNNLDNDGYLELVDHPDGAAHFGAWVVILEIASRSKPRGTLLRNGNRPHTPQSLARISRLPAGLFEAALPRLVSIGWVNTYGIPQDGAIISHPCATIQDKTDSTIQDKAGTPLPPKGGKASDWKPVVTCWNAMAKRCGLPSVRMPPAEKYVRKLRSLVKNADFMANYETAIAKCKASNKAGGLGIKFTFSFATFLSRWFEALEGKYDVVVTDSGGGRPTPVYRETFIGFHVTSDEEALELASHNSEEYLRAMARSAKSPEIRRLFRLVFEKRAWRQ